MFARVSTLPLVWLVYTTPGDSLWAWRGVWVWLGNGLTMGAVAGFVVSSRGYDINEAMLVSVLAIVLYFVTDSRLEERKLIALHGVTYRSYQDRVPILVPLPWRLLGSG